MSHSHSKYAGRVVDRSLGTGGFGKARVNCRALLKKSHWGTLDQCPTGILRLRLSLYEPEGFKLSKAEVDLSFLADESSGEKPTIEDAFPVRLYGPALDRRRTRGRSLEPQVDVSGIVSLGGVGVHDTDDWTQTSRWHFSSDPKADDERFYTQISWAWIANKRNEENETVQPFELAIVLEHSACTFSAAVEVNGKLRSSWRRLRFPATKQPPSPEFITLREGEQSDLGQIIASLRAEIDRLNNAVSLAPPAPTVPGAGDEDSATTAAPVESTTTTGTDIGGLATDLAQTALTAVSSGAV